MFAIGLKCSAWYPSWVQEKELQRQGRDCTGSSPALNLKTTRVGPDKEEEEEEKKKRGKRSCGLLALPGSNHSREKESRPLSRQPLREPVGGNTGAAQAVLFIKTHTHTYAHIRTHTHTTQLVSLAASFLLIWLCRSQMQSEQKREQLL